MLNARELVVNLAANTLGMEAENITDQTPLTQRQHKLIVMNISDATCLSIKANNTTVGDLIAAVIAAEKG
jgi:hypothetical protein